MILAHNKIKNCCYRARDLLVKCFLRVGEGYSRDSDSYSMCLFLGVNTPTLANFKLLM